MWVIKIGGSLLSSGCLNQWLSIIVKHGAGKVILVPGGGVFADQVRIAQRECKFDDETAHQMALLAMEQYAHVLKYYAPDLVLSDSIEEIEKLITQKKIPVCLPCKMVMQNQGLPASWKLTSDSLALWLTDQLNAEHTMLLKSSRIESPTHVSLSARQLSETGLVDSAFPDFVSHTRSSVWWLNKDETNLLENVLKTERSPADVFRCITD